MKSSAKQIRLQLRALGDTDAAAHAKRFFKTGKGEYAEGDRFLGVRVPVVRRAVRAHRDAPERTVLTLLRSPFHEERLLALLLMANQFGRAAAEGKARIYARYLEHTAYVNNWDLVDSSAPQIVGAFLEQRSKRPLYRLARSRDLWERRIAIIATLHFIRHDSFDAALAIAERLLHDDEDLIHKAVGWMLREVGNRDRSSEERFLRAHYRHMPRTMLRYAIEKFPEARRKAYLAGTVR